jgi:UDP-glucose 4-epimerase
MRVLVTGAAGFIGSHLVDRLVRDGHQVAGVDDLSSGDARNIADAVRAGAAYHRMDVTAPELVGLAVGWRPEAVCHLAAQISVRASVEDPVADALVNVLGTVNVLEAARAAGARKVVFTSSAAVYGIPVSMPVPAEAGLAPRSPYAASKVCGEVYLGAYRVLHGLDFTTLALSNVYGPRQRPDGEAGVVAIFADALLRGAPTHVYGDGKQARDYVYVADVVDAYVLACGSRASGARLNVGTGIRTTDLELHAAMAAAAGRQCEPGYAPGRPGDLPEMALDPGLTEDMLGWAPSTSLRGGIAATLDWMRLAQGTRDEL